MSAPWASMWVAQEWRSTWGLTRSARPDGPGVGAHDRVGALPGQAPATGVEEHRLGVAAPPPLLGRQRRHARSGASQPPSACGGAASERDQALLGPLAVEAHEPVSGREVGQVQPDRLGDPGTVP